VSVTIDAGFDGGNILVEGGGPEAWDLAIRKDAHSDFLQWFHFRVTGAAGRPLVLAIRNAGEAAYPHGWPGYRARVSEDREDWRQAETSYANGILTIRHTPSHDVCWFAYFAPYPMERHHWLIGRAAAAPGVRVRSLGQTIDGQPMDLVTMGEAGPAVWLYARQHPGETMAQWWMEGAIARLTDPADPVARALRARCRLFLVPNMNPDGSRRGHLRTNALGVNLNRVWHAPDAKTEPEVACVLAEMERTGVDFAMDVHGDEAIPHVFIAGFEGIPAASERQTRLYQDYVARLARLSPDFQTAKGYEPSKPGEGNMTMSTNAIAHRFGCPAFTLEMPFKDADDLPDPLRGWSPGRSQALARDCLAALLETLPDL
jgi:murein tripeptide amidase MpaA